MDPDATPSFDPVAEPVTPVVKAHRHYFALVIAGLLVLILFKVAGDEKHTQLAADNAIEHSTEAAAPVVSTLQLPQQTAHIQTPATVHAIYLTGWTAGSTKRLDRIYSILDTADINAVVVDIKDATGRLSYIPQDQALAQTGVGQKRITDLPGLIQQLHDRGIYVIGRVAVFQDPFFAAAHPEDTFTDTRTGGTWRDYKGIAWLRPDSEAVWRYVAQISHDAYAQGFDEINVDYVRYPSDGDLKFIDSATQVKSKVDTVGDFFTYLDQELRGSGIPLSADVFGLTLSVNDGLGIGQKVEVISPHVDYLCPMIYPSHYYNGTFGIAVPAGKPYEIIHRALTDGISKMQAAGESTMKLRPWLQDFDLLGVTYTAPMIEAQIRASEELGINSWLFWDPKNIYTKEGFPSR